MAQSDQLSEVPVDPTTPIAELARSLSSATVHCLLGLLLGVAAARLMRRRNLHWSLALLALAIGLLVRAALGRASLTLAVAAIVAALRGRRWHREDLEAGADLATLAKLRSGPLELARRAALWWRAAGSTPRSISRSRRAGELVIGHDRRHRRVFVGLGDGGSGRHTLVVGATGSGKTVTQAWISVSAIERGMGAIVLDPKGDRAMREQLRRAAGDAGRRFIEWTPQGESVYNPYERGTDTEIADKTLAGERFTEPHYLRQAQRYLGHVVRALRASGREVSLRGIVELLDPDRLEVLARALPEAGAEATHAYLDSLSGRQQADLSGVRDRLAILAESDVGPWLDPHTDGDRFDLLGAIEARAVVYFSLESDRRPLLAQMLGAAIVQDLQTTVASLQGSPVPTLVVIDEFSAVAAEQVVRLFGRARSAGLSLLLGTQELSDLRPAGRERLLEQIMGNLSALIAHRQVVPASAELIASVAGSRGAWRVARHSDGRTTRTRTREAILDASEVMSLDPGWAAVIALAGPGGARIAQVLSADRER